MDMHAGRRVVVNGLPLYHEDSGGDGRPLVLLPGGVQTIDLSFGTLRPRLVGRRTLAVEPQAHGRTPDIDRDITVPNMAGDVLALLDHLGVPDADVFGFSLGGLVALELAVRHPDRVRCLIAAAAQARPDGFHDEIWDPALQSGSTRMPTAADFAAMRTEYQRVAPDPDHFDEAMARISGAAQGWSGWSEAELAQITARTLVVIGDHDFVRVEHAAWMATVIPDARLAVLPGTTHMSLCHRADLLVPMLDELLGGE
jgi:pimeloyl-ACP methyl ester carboxylesterase